MYSTYLVLYTGDNPHLSPVDLVWQVFAGILVSIKVSDVATRTSATSNTSHCLDILLVSLEEIERT